MAEIVKVKSGNLTEETSSYSRLVVAGDTIYVSNTAGRNYTTRELPEDVAGQARQALKNIEGALASVGATLRDVVRIRIFVPDRDDKEIVNRIIGETFKGIDPANTTLCTPLGKPELKVEFEVTAYRRRNPDAPEHRFAIKLD